MHEVGVTEREGGMEGGGWRKREEGEEDGGREKTTRVSCLSSCRIHPFYTC